MIKDERIRNIKTLEDLRIEKERQRTRISNGKQQIFGTIKGVGTAVGDQFRSSFLGIGKNMAFWLIGRLLKRRRR